MIKPTDELAKLKAKKDAALAEYETALKDLKAKQAAIMEKRAGEIGKLAEKVGVLDLPDAVIAGALVKTIGLFNRATEGDEKARAELAALSEAGAPFCAGKRGRKPGAANVGKADASKTSGGTVHPQSGSAADNSGSDKSP